VPCAALRLDLGSSCQRSDVHEGPVSGLGLDAVAVFLFEKASPETVWALQSAAFLLAAPAAGAGLARARWSGGVIVTGAQFR
jgi:hypothetical protein